MEDQPIKIRDSRRPGWFWASNEILDIYGVKIGAYAVAVYMVMCRHANNTTGKCSPSIRRIASMLDISNATVKRSIAALENAKLVKVSRDGSGPYSTNIYTLVTVPNGLAGNDGLDPARCWYCGITTVEIINEHQNPTSRFTDSKIVSACRPCNELKSDRTVSEFRKMFPTGHRFYGEQIGSIGTHPVGTEEMGSIGTVNVPVDSEIGSIGAANKTINTNNTFNTSLFPETEDQTRKEPKGKNKVKTTDSFELPPWMPVEPWEAWIEQRAKAKSPVSDKAKKMAVNKIKQMWDSRQGTPTEILEQTVINGWKGFWPVKGDSTNGRGSKDTERINRNRAILARNLQAGSGEDTGHDVPALPDGVD